MILFRYFSFKRLNNVLVFGGMNIEIKIESVIYLGEKLASDNNDSPITC